jgi:hypothetical protein
MDSLYQRLKELDSDTFQRLCFYGQMENHVKTVHARHD